MRAMLARLRDAYRRWRLRRVLKRWGEDMAELDRAIDQAPPDLKVFYETCKEACQREAARLRERV